MKKVLIVQNVMYKVQCQLHFYVYVVPLLAFVRWSASRFIAEMRHAGDLTRWYPLVMMHLQVVILFWQGGLLGQLQFLFVLSDECGVHGDLWGSQSGHGNKFQVGITDKFAG